MGLGSNEIKVALPPGPSLLRDLVITSLATIHSASRDLGNELRIEVRGDEVLISNIRDWDIIIQTVINEVINVLDVKVELGIRAPKLNQNDFNYVFKKLVGTLTKNSTYLDAFRELLRSNNLISKLSNLNQVRKELSSVGVTGRNELLLGASRGYPLLQIFKVESYETGLSFHRPYTMKFSIRCSDVWLGLLGIGFAYSYSGLYGGRTSLITFRGDVSELHGKVDVALQLSLTLIRAPPTPIIPYLMYTSLAIPDVIRSDKAPEMLGDEAALITKSLLSKDEAKKLREMINLGYVPPLNLHILTVGKAFTAISRLPIDYSTPLKFSYILDEVCSESGINCRDELRSFIRLGLGADEPKAVNAITLLYEAISGAKDPSLATYYLLRTISELIDSGSKIRLSRACVDSLLKALELMSM